MPFNHKGEFIRSVRQAPQQPSSQSGIGHQPIPARRSEDATEATRQEAHRQAAARQDAGAVQASRRNLVVLLKNTGGVGVATGLLLIAAGSCAVLLRIEEQLKLNKEKARLAEVQRLYNSRDYTGCIREVAEVRSDLREQLRIEALDLRGKCLFGELGRIRDAIASDTILSSSGVDSLKQLFKDLRFVANEGYSDQSLRQLTLEAREALTSKIRARAENLFRTSPRINEVVALLELVGDKKSAASVKSDWRDDEQLLKDTKSRLESLTPRNHQPFEMPRFKTVFWKQEYDNYLQGEFKQVLPSKLFNFAGFYAENKQWERCVRYAELADRAANESGDNSLAGQISKIHAECTAQLQKSTSDPTPPP